MSDQHLYCTHYHTHYVTDIFVSVQTFTVPNIFTSQIPSVPNISPTHPRNSPHNITISRHVPVRTTACALAKIKSFLTKSFMFMSVKHTTKYLKNQQNIHTI